MHLPNKTRWIFWVSEPWYSHAARTYNNLQSTQGMTINRTGPHRVKLADVSARRQFAPGSLANHEMMKALNTKK